MISSRVNQLFIYLFLLVGITPYFGAADKVVPQILYLNILNFSAIAYIIYNNLYRENILLKTINSLPVLLYFLFFIWSGITIFNSINIFESLSVLGNIFTYLISFSLLIFFIQKIKNYKLFFFYLITFLSCLEIITVLVPYIHEINTQGSPSLRGMIYRGYTGNINILAYLMLMKMPFFFYFQFLNLGNKKLNFFIIVSKVFIISSIFSTRSAILAILFICFFILISLILLNKKESINIKDQILSYSKKIILPLVLGFTVANIASNFFNSISVQTRLSTLSNISEDQSLSERLTFYNDAIQSIREKPIMGKGIGSWEYESVNYIKDELDDYVVPYHAHNDFLEVFAETGLIGFTLYFGMIFVIVFSLLKKMFDYNVSYNDRLFSLFLISSIIVYLIDSMFNFPFDRVIQQIFLFFILATSINFLKFEELKINIHKFFYVAVIILTPISIYSSTRLFYSSQDQKIFLKQFNQEDWSTPSLEDIDKFEMKYKNLGPTALPMSTIKGIFFLKNNRFNEAVPMLKKGIKDNPYLYISHSFLGYTYFRLNKIDSALVYSKKAFDSMPEVPVHFANYAYSLIDLKDSTALKSAYLKKDNWIKQEIFDEIYLLAMSSIITDRKNNFGLDGLQIDLSSGNDRLLKNYYTLRVGESKMYKADELYQMGIYYFEQNNFQLAFDFFYQADKINPFELAYKENAANSLIRLGKDQEALEILNDLIINFNSKNAKAYYLRALVLFTLDRKVEACKDFKYSYENGLIEKNMYELACFNN